MTLGKRALLVIFPVILIIQLVAATAAYLTQRSALLDLEQARLAQQLSALKSAYLDYEAFNRSVLYSIMESEALLAFLREADTAFRNDTLGLSIQQAIRSLSTAKLSFASVAIVQPDGEPAYYFESSLSPFASMNVIQQQVVRQAKQGLEPAAMVYVEQAEGGPLLLQTDFILPASGSRPLPSQRGEAFALQLAVRPEAFIALKQALEHEYRAQLEIAAELAPIQPELSADVLLSRSLYARLTPAPEYLAERLQTLRLAFLAGGALVCVVSIGLLLLLIRRYVTAPISQLDDQLTDLLLCKRAALDEPTVGGEIGRLTLNMKTLHDHNTAALRRIQEISWTDSLTQTSNRAHFGMLANAMYERCLHSDKRLALLFIDLDNFKQVNDQHGHDAGDTLLRIFAQRAQGVLEAHRLRHPQTETALARLSGDEFAILLLTEPGAADLEELCEALLGLCRGGFRLEDRLYPVGLSIGTARYPDDADSITQLLTRADTAMYQAKAEGKNAVVAFSGELAQRNERIRLIEEQLRALDGDDQLRLVYMPALDREGAVVSCEVLLRWHSPILGTVSPAEFIPIAERAGLFPKIDSWVIDHALAEYPELVRLFGEGVILAINVSSAQLVDDRICRYLVERAAHHGIEPGRIEIELTETYAAELSKDTMAVVKGMRQAGFRVAIDDFGVGYTSFQQLLQYPADTIKLDMVIVDSLTRPDMQQSLAALIAFCHAQGKRVNAEGVDNMEKQSALLEAGCDLFQGYLLSPPRSLSALEDWMAVRRRALAPLRLEQLTPREVSQPG
ncbi:MAG TPA: GGDEF-domain containing protein [Pseudomonas sp.]|uniref:putative bifunctional diguanylate cyclase/phosphodiesterase n=1 Tax=Stutzerimonas frequens TaxID=2968969 RepID=UPI000C63AA19|nr:EAL domain-containing protein [Stutzerimonas frequens]MAL90402.1 GGDEF-domain containing protein [Pseudomonas sp.]QFU10737.1 Cyclic di-GMP phosphodiesterase Gmr [Stutzerimonas frequens]HAW61986.1 GGDEF-domain containing protein [Pseudomonas sp.]|tara:strand:- start:822 stop:3194 length:2373 start_codon:yes stop_codon:yes gene_type:complete